VLSEEALILIGVVGACALLILGILELVWPSQPRHPVRRPQPAPPTATPAKAAPAVAAKAPPAAAPAPPPTRLRRSTVSPHARPHAGHADRVTEPPPVPAPVPPLAMARPAPASSAPAPTPAALAPRAPEMHKPDTVVAPPGPFPAPAATGQVEPLLLERCFALYQDRRYDEVVSTGEEALGRLRDTPRSPPEAHAAAALWSVVGLAKQALGNHAGAGVALEAALRIAPAGERVTYAQHIADLALSAAQTALARAGNHDADDHDRVLELRSALAWTERGLSAVPSDPRLRARSQTARAELWPTYEQSVHKLLRRQEFRVARYLLREALEDPEIPAARVAPFEELLSGTFAGEIGQLTAQAIRSMEGGNESEALTALRRAEDLLGTIPDEALPPKRREELDQRLLWGYTQLGVRRVEAGDHEAALDPLVRALKLAGIGPDRQAETRAALVRALEGVADVRALSIRQLNDAGDRDGAVLRTQTLHELLRSCVELGLSADDVLVASAKTRRLCEELGMGDRA
jgi:tetratricopeptide (TPR) repeat protein